MFSFLLKEPILIVYSQSIQRYIFNNFEIRYHYDTNNKTINTNYSCLSYFEAKIGDFLVNADKLD